MSTYKKILVSDYDQTFYLNDEDIEKNKIAINRFREKGNIFVIATGRSFFDFKNKSDLYDIDYDYVIINHGATILNKNNNITYNFSINNEIIDELKQDLEIEKSMKTFCCSELESRVDFDYKNLTKIHVKYNDKETAMTINDKINKKYDKYINAYFVTGNAIEIIAKETDKSFAIELLLKDLEVSKNCVYTIGDGYSDIEMIRNFNGYCMKESVDELKALAEKEYESVSSLVNDLMEDNEDE
ncbi:MAG: HAD-IIB family hydrolase [Bacilli bacterium]|nr:HAD-IIB family hydrolase [Bacilli bacterium]